MLGPIIRAEVGDTVKVVFENTASHNHTMHPHGLRYAKENEGLAPGQEFGGNAVPPGSTWTYTWGVPGEACYPFLEETLSNLATQNVLDLDLWTRRPRLGHIIPILPEPKTCSAA